MAVPCTDADTPYTCLFTDIFPSAASMTSTHHSFDCTLCTFTVQEDEERLAGLTDSDVLKVQEAAGAALAEANERLLEAELRVQAAQVKPLQHSRSHQVWHFVCFRHTCCISWHLPSCGVPCLSAARRVPPMVSSCVQPAAQPS